MMNENGEFVKGSRWDRRWGGKAMEGRGGTGEVIGSVLYMLHFKR
jgi:hypothetical protein